MSDMKTAILDAAERRIQAGGFGGFSFREIAEDVGIKSSSVHYHFPTKEDLAAEVVRRWADRTSENIDREFAKDPNRQTRLGQGVSWNGVLESPYVSVHHPRRFLAGSAEAGRGRGEAVLQDVPGQDGRPGHVHGRRHRIPVHHHRRTGRRECAARQRGVRSGDSDFPGRGKDRGLISIGPMIGFRSSDLDGDDACETSSATGRVIGWRARDAVSGDRLPRTSEISRSTRPYDVRQEGRSVLIEDGPHTIVGRAVHRKP